MTRRFILFYFLFLTFLLSFLVSQSFLVSATTITDLSLSTNGHPMRWISNHQQLVTLHFTIDEEQGYAYLDLSELETDPGLASAHSNERFDLSLCTPQGIPNKTPNTEQKSTSNSTSNSNSNNTSNSTSNEYHSICSEELVVQLTNSTVTIPYRLFIGGQNFYGNKTLKFSIDNSSPIVTGIKTSICKDNPPRCFVGNNIPTNVTVTIDDAVGSFDNHLIFYKLGSRIFAVDNCSDNTCTGVARITCVDNARLDLFVTDANGVKSQDDAGNPVKNPGEITRVICDASPPKIESINVVGNDLGLVTNKGSFKVVAKIHETVGTVKMDANLSELNLSSQQITCVRGGGDTQTCTLTVSNPLAGRSKKIPLIFTDDLGLTASAEVDIPMILAVANETNQTIDFFDVKATSVSPRTNNRVALQLAMDNNFDYPYFIRYSFTQNEPGTKILKQELDGTTCKMIKKPKNYQNPFGPNDNKNWSQALALFNDFSVFYPNADWNVQNRLDTSFLDIDTSKFPHDLILVKCNLSLTVQKDGVFYPKPEMETIYFPVRFYNSKLGTPGKAFLKKMNDERDKLNGGLSKLIGLANKVFSTFADLCQMQQLLIMLNTPGLQMEAMGLMMMQFGAGSGLAQAGSGAANAAISTSMTYWTGAMPEIMAHKGVSSQDALKAKASARKFCNFVYCDVANKTDEANKKGSGILGADANFMQGVGEKTAGKDYFGDYFSNLNTPDVSNSLIMSVATQCWSGVVYNLNKYRQIDCGYLACLREQALGGASIAPCELARGVKMCRFITGEIFELPYIRVIKNLAANVNKLIQSPLILLMNKWNTVDCKGADTKPGWKGFGCHVMHTLSIQQDFQSVTKYNLLFTFPKEADLCQKALCEGKECDYKTASFLEQLVPGSSQTGDQYRISWMKDHETKVLQKYGQAVIDYLHIDENGNTSVTSDQLQANTAFQMYVKKGVTNPADKKNIADQLTLRGPKGIANRNIFRDRLKEGKVPITSSKQLEALNTKKGGWNVETADYTTNQRVANTMETISSIDSRVCENGAYANPELCKQYHEALDQFHKDTGYSVTTDGGYCICNSGKGSTNTDHQCTSCKDKEQNKDEFDKLQKTAKEKGDKAFNAKLLYGWVDALTSTLYQYLKENGQTDFLFLSGWGDWGSKLSEESNKLLNPEEWKNNLCNPAGSFNNYVQDTGSVYAWQDSNYRAVLTFAGEILPFGGNKSGNRSYLYTASAVVVSPFDDNEMSVILNPGGKVLGKGITLSKGQVVNKAFSAKESKHYKDICVLFSKPFPKVDGETQYCRPLERNAYDRGGVTKKGLPDWGIDDPYANNPTNSTGSGGFTSQLFGGLNGMGGGATVTGGTGGHPS